MKKGFLACFTILFGVFVFSGCVVRTYPLVKDRVDQDLNTGNHGYFKGQVPLPETSARKTTRTTHVVEVEMFPPIKFEHKPKEESRGRIRQENLKDSALWGNRGYVNAEAAPEIPAAQKSAVAVNFEKYTVQKGDTLQKISGKFYGTSKKWSKIYEANKDTLKGPDKIYPGKVLNIPVEPLKETKENLK